MTMALLLEDDASSSLALRSVLEDEGVEVLTCFDTDAACEVLEQQAPDILVADWCVGGAATTAEIARLVRSRNPAAAIIFVTGYPPEELSDEIRDLEPYQIFSKPLDFDELLRQAGRELQR